MLSRWWNGQTISIIGVTGVVKFQQKKIKDQRTSDDIREQAEKKWLEIALDRTWSRIRKGLQFTSEPRPIMIIFLGSQ